ncbi:hypothetical protein [Marinobacter caseinilyticus]|uniref:hypothetical protein n=1 Tax=Marinobacter caseinilyticus TaxID=2692195 RepID=UPI00140B5E51|nr:hypothetical protein [Marinobacter caseinilyticus]
MAHADDELVESARIAADKGDWAEFIEIMSGPCAKRTDQPIKTAKWLEVDEETGEYLDCPVNQYGEPSKGKLFGLFAQGRYWLTRVFRWEVKRPKKENSSVTTGVEWLNNLARLTNVREATEAEIAALPDDTAYTWEKRNAEICLPLEFCQ